MTALQQMQLQKLEEEYNREMNALERKLRELEREQEALKQSFLTKLESLEKEWLN
jgi:hypothetical protein